MAPPGGNPSGGSFFGSPPLLNTGMLKKSEVLKEGYEKGLNAAIAMISKKLLSESPVDMESCETAGALAVRLTAKIEAKKERSAWRNGVKQYAVELLEDLAEGYGDEEVCNWNMLHKMLLNGASSWQQYSEGGCSLIYDGQIAERLCSPSELKKTDHGRKDPNDRENWIACQARALFQAEQLIRDAYEEA